MRTALYARVSTSDKGQDPEMQLRELREHCSRLGWTIAGEYVDIGVSGSKDSRPELNKLVADAHRRKLDAVLVWKLDRFGRSLKHLVNSLAEFESLGIAFISLKESLDLTTPAGRLMFGIVSAMAEFERDLIRERVRAGISNRRARGFRVGRKPIVLDADRLAKLRSEGLTIREIARTLRCSRSLVHKTLVGTGGLTTLFS
jgi:DNA invertase Pin-like site-specific DNA recombinase